MTVNKQMWIIVLIFMGAIIAACPKPAPERARYDYEPPSREWTPLRGEDGTLLFRRTSPPMGIMVHTMCDRYRNAPLAPLSNNLFIGFENRKLIDRGDTKVAGRDARYIIMECTTKSAPVKVKAYTFRKGPCIYDIAYFSEPDHFNDQLDTFEEFVASFEPK